MTGPARPGNAEFLSRSCSFIRVLHLARCDDHRRSTLAQVERMAVEGALDPHHIG